METMDLLTIVLNISTVQVLLAWWIQARLGNSIKHEYDKKLESLKLDHIRKEKAAVVAEFLAEWTHIDDPKTKRLNQLLWELTLYLPAELVQDIKLMVTKQSDDKTAPQILVAIRNHLLDGSDPINESDITYFHHPANTSMTSFNAK